MVIVCIFISVVTPIEHFKVKQTLSVFPLDLYNLLNLCKLYYLQKNSKQLVKKKKKNYEILIFEC